MSTHGQPQQVFVLPSTSTTTLLKVCLVVCSLMVMMVFLLRQMDQIKFQPHRISHPHQERKPENMPSSTVF